MFSHEPRFTQTPLRRPREPDPLQYLREKTSFWIAVLSLFAFVAGNMLGRHGWYAFWASVIGGYDDSLIAYRGTLTPIELVPDYTQWSVYGGNVSDHTFRQVPRSILIPLPPYGVKEQRLPHNLSDASDVYSIGHMGSYSSGAEGEGSHPGVDIRVPEGTPVRVIANGVVTQVRDSASFGQIIVVRHPHMPDPRNPKEETVLHSVYAHLSSQFVSRGQVVSKGDVIALSGRTGNVTGPHLHFQIDRDDAPWHPYWPFSESETEAAGLSFTAAIDRGFNQDRGYQYTIHPMLYVQANYPPIENIFVTAVAARETSGSEPRPSGVVVVQGHASSSVPSRTQRKYQQLAHSLEVRDERMRERMNRKRAVQRIAPHVLTQPRIVREEKIARAESEIESIEDTTVGSVLVQHDGSYSGRGWEKITLTLLNAQGGRVLHPLKQSLILRTAYGDAEFRPNTLSTLDFVNGVMEVQMLPQGRRTIVVQVFPFNSLSEPMKYQP